MKILILSCNTGEGHNAAGRAIFHELQSRGVACEMVDALSFAGSNISKRVSSCYTAITTKMPNVFRAMYHAGNFISSNRHKSPVYLLNRLYQDAVLQYIREHKISFAVMPHLFPAQTLTALKLERGLEIGTLAIATDYTCIPFWEETDMQNYVIPHESLAREFCEKGIAREKLLPFGIPVERAFFEKTDRVSARRALGLPLDAPIFLIMSGSMGYGDLENLISSYTGPAKLVVLCGRNEKLRLSLAKLRDDLCLVPFTQEVPLYMSAADVLFTKPGGLTSTEAAVHNIPLIHTKPIPGCETKNAEFYQNHKLSYYNKDIPTMLRFADSLIQDKARREEMLSAQRAVINPHAREQICDFILEKARSSG